MSENKKNSMTVLAVVAIIVVLGLGYFLYLQKKQAMRDVSAPAESAEQSASTDEPQLKDNIVEEVVINVEEALSDRILGDVNAPLKISEHSSLTCSHCGAFHKNTFRDFKAAYIDTGKAYLVFSDFPLNAPAIHASMIARCLPKDQYFDFVQMLFEEQDSWAHDAGYLSFLKAKAAQKGMNDATFQSCLKNQDIQNGIITRMKNAQATYNITSTPSFVLNNERVISGALPFEVFKQPVEEELQKLSGPGEQEESEEAVSEELPEDNDTPPAAAEDSSAE